LDGGLVKRLKHFKSVMNCSLPYRCLKQNE